jgi:uracil-DNA glycosylase family 4
VKTLSPELTPELRRAVAERVQFYRELGIYDLYRQPVSAEIGVAASPLSADLLPVIRDGAGPVSTQDRVSALHAILEDIGDCTRCRLHKGRTNLVFGTGNPNAELMFIGEGPGADEDAQGLPFVGRAGQLLNNMIAAMGLKREDVYIANIVKCRPPQNRTPEKDECDTCSPFLMRQISVIQPKAIVALGATAAKNLLGLSDSMSSLRGRSYEFTPPGYAADAIRLFVTYHPAYLLRDPRQKKEAWKDLQLVMKYLDLAPPKQPAPAQD